MPQIFKIGSYWVYFWANENEPLEPIHVHIAEGKPTANATKIKKCEALIMNGLHIPKVLAMLFCFQVPAFFFQAYPLCQSDS